MPILYNFWDLLIYIAECTASESLNNPSVSHKVTSVKTGNIEATFLNIYTSIDYIYSINFNKCICY